MIPLNIAKELHEVPEHIVIDAAKFVGQMEGTKNSWTKLLEAAAVFKHAGASPIFLANKDSTSFAVSSEETFMKRLH